MSSVFMGDVGTIISINCGLAVNTASVMEILVKRPDLSTAVWSAIPDGAQSIKHVIQAGELNMPGVWQLQPRIVMPTWKGRGSWVELRVER